MVSLSWTLWTKQCPLPSGTSIVHPLTKAQGNSMEEGTLAQDFHGITTFNTSPWKGEGSVRPHSYIRSYGQLTAAEGEGVSFLQECGQPSVSCLFSSGQCYSHVLIGDITWLYIKKNRRGHGSRCVCVCVCTQESLSFTNFSIGLIFLSSIL